ncbi:MAG TPA: hypothetical protein VFS50_06680 [Meiothermus sp.]|nr:hypothetical protein [Meiothermus sp.]
MEATTRLAQNFQLGLGVKVDRVRGIGLEGGLPLGSRGFSTVAA